MPFFKKHQTRPRTILTPPAASYASAYKQQLAELRIKHRQPSPGKLSGFIERFAEIFEADFLRGSPCRETVFDDLGALKKALSVCLAQFNSAELQGFPNFGVAPIKGVERAIKIASQKSATAS